MHSLCSCQVIKTELWEIGVKDYNKNQEKYRKLLEKWAKKFDIELHKGIFLLKIIFASNCVFIQNSYGK